jgi:hypothetical protein
VEGDKDGQRRDETDHALRAFYCWKKRTAAITHEAPTAIAVL